ncbi:MAG: prephenate dehydrogenase/arogenate dehydrogenase family protein [Thermoleophilia bacterium]|nr:prephenate dehydrogenase/arogenate dehydrogenase family protein [Thermoleophilia bacterium]
MSQPGLLRDATVAIVGLGLMGSSLGLALERRCARRLGVDAKRVAASRSLELGAVDETSEDLAATVARADLVVLAVPVRSAIELTPLVADAMRADAVLTDVGSTKGELCRAFDQVGVRSVGGHPMCGREQSGPGAASADLFEDATWALCPTRHTDEHAIELVRTLARAVDANPVKLDRDAHDRAVATASHLPYVAAQALARVAASADDQTDGDVALLAATGFASATRLARGSTAMWSDILATNTSNVRDAITALRDELDRIARMIDDDDLAALLEAGVADAARVNGS